MLAGIGGTIVLAQLHVVLGGKPQTSALENLIELPGQLLNLHGAAVIVGLCTVGLVLGWPRLPGPLRAVPGPLVAVAAATGLSLLLNSFSSTPVPRVALPGGLLSAVHMPLLPDGQWGAVVGGVLTVAMIASVESLLSAVAVDRMHQGQSQPSYRPNQSDASHKPPAKISTTPIQDMSPVILAAPDQKALS